MSMTLNRVNAQNWGLGIVVAAVLVSPAAAQIPDPTPALNAAKNARAQTEAAQKKNAEALDPQAPAQGARGASGAQGASGASGAPGAPQAEKPPSGPGYSYDPAGRRDPFVTLIGRGGDTPAPGSVRPQGLAGMLIGEVTLKGVLKTTKGDFVALLQAADNKTYIAHTGDKVLDGAVKTITAAEVVFTQDVNDPLSLVKQREVRKAIRPEAR
jgi:hypothetical protein